MKEKMITFTRNRKNKPYLIMLKIGILVNFAIFYAFYYINTQINLVIRLAVVIPTVIILLGIYIVCSLFDINESIIRNNKLLIILLSYTDIVYFILVLIFLFITQGKIQNIFVLTSVFVICLIISSYIGKYFRKRVKYE